MIMHSFGQKCPQFSQKMSASIACTLAAFCGSAPHGKIRIYRVGKYLNKLSSDSSEEIINYIKYIHT
jgi:hypothetical protein